MRASRRAIPLSSRGVSVEPGLTHALLSFFLEHHPMDRSTWVCSRLMGPPREKICTSRSFVQLVQREEGAPVEDLSRLCRAQILVTDLVRRFVAYVELEVEPINVRIRSTSSSTVTWISFEKMNAWPRRSGFSTSCSARSMWAAAPSSAYSVRHKYWPHLIGGKHISVGNQHLPPPALRLPPPALRLPSKPPAPGVQLQRKPSVHTLRSNNTSLACR